MNWIDVDVDLGYWYEIDAEEEKRRGGGCQKRFAAHSYVSGVLQQTTWYLPVLSTRRTEYARRTSCFPIHRGRTKQSSSTIGDNG